MKTKFFSDTEFTMFEGEVGVRTHVLLSLLAVRGQSVRDCHHSIYKFPAIRRSVVSLSPRYYLKMKSNWWRKFISLCVSLSCIMMVIKIHGAWRQKGRTRHEWALSADLTIRCHRFLCRMWMNALLFSPHMTFLHKSRRWLCPALFFSEIILFATTFMNVAPATCAALKIAQVFQDVWEPFCFRCDRLQVCRLFKATNPFLVWTKSNERLLQVSWKMSARRRRKQTPDQDTRRRMRSPQ